MTRLESLIQAEQKHRALSHSHKAKAEEHWNRANEILLEIQALEDDKKELDCSE